MNCVGTAATATSRLADRQTGPTSICCTGVSRPETCPITTRQRSGDLPRETPPKPVALPGGRPNCARFCWGFFTPLLAVIQRHQRTSKRSIKKLPTRWRKHTWNRQARVTRSTVVPTMTSSWRDHCGPSYGLRWICLLPATWIAWVRAPHTTASIFLWTAREIAVVSGVTPRAAETGNVSIGTGKRRKSQLCSPVADLTPAVRLIVRLHQASARNSECVC